MAVSDVDLTPTESMARAAERGLQLREEHGRGGTEVGVARARDLKNRKTLSPSTVRRMHSFFSRHAVDKKGKGWKSGSEGYPSAGLIAHLLWGGDPGASWAARKVKELDRAEGKSESSRGDLYSPMTVQRYDPDCPDSVCEPTMFSKSNTSLILGIAAKPAVFAGNPWAEEHPSVTVTKMLPEIKAAIQGAGMEPRVVRKCTWDFPAVIVVQASDGVRAQLEIGANKRWEVIVNYGAVKGAPLWTKVKRIATGRLSDIGSAIPAMKKALAAAKKPWKPTKKSDNSMDDACWPGYEAIGTKVKDGKRVPNCVPAK